MNSETFAAQTLTVPGGGAALVREGDAYVAPSGERYSFEDGILRTLRSVDPQLALEIEAQAASVDDYADPRLLMPRYEPRMAELAIAGMFGGNPPVGKRVLDAGCGIGLLGRLYPQLDLVGLDVSMPLLRQAQTGYALRVEGSAEAMPFADASFDVVVALNMLHHVITPAAALREFARVVRPGGSLIVIDPRKVFPIEVAKAILRAKDRTVAPTHRAFTVDEYRSLVEGGGDFEIEVEKRVGFVSLIVAGGIDALKLPRRIPSAVLAAEGAKLAVRALAGVDDALFRLPGVPRAGLNLTLKARRVASLAGPTAHPVAKVGRASQHAHEIGKVMANEEALSLSSDEDDEAAAAAAPEVDYVPSTKLRVMLKGSVPKELFEGSDGYGWYMTLKVFVPLFAAIVAMPFARARFGYWVWPVGVPIMGVLLYKVQFLQHDCSHKSLFKTMAWNERIGGLCGLLAGASLSVYRHIHGRHHRLNGEPDDPQFKDFLGDRFLPRWPYIWFIVSPLLGGRVSGFMNRELKSITNVAKAKPVAAVNAPTTENNAVSKPWLLSMLVFQAVLATVVTGFWRYPSLALMYFVGGFTVTLFLARVRTLAEHEQPVGRSPVGFTRSHTAHWFDQIFLYEANFNYHLEHHIFPHMPSGKLAEFSKQFGPRFHTADTMGRSMIYTLWVRFVASPRRVPTPDPAE